MGYFCYSQFIYSACPEIRAIARARVYTHAKSPARVKNCPCQHHCQPCNRTCQTGTSLSAAATQVTVTFCFHNYALSCFILNETFDMLQQQKTLYFEYTNLGQTRAHVRIGALAPISSGHGLYLLFASYVDWISDSNKGLVANTSRIFPLDRKTFFI